MNKLMTNKMKKVSNKKGFTLIELIVVIAILGILAAIAIPRLTGVRSGAEVKADAASLKTIESTLSVAIANGDIKYDATEKEWYVGADTTDITGTDNAALWTALVGPYLDERPESSQDNTKQASITLADDGTYTTSWVAKP